MPNPLISPNLHVVLIHYPLAMLIAGVLIELFSFMWPRSGFRGAGRWMILLGAFSAIIAAYSGIYALRDIARVEPDMPWLRFKTDSPVFKDPTTWAMLWHHALYQSIAAVVSATVVTVWLGCSDRRRASLRLPLLAVLVWMVAMMISAAWLGGESVYRNGVGTQTQFPQLVAKEAATTQPTNWSTGPTRIEQLQPPIELHVIMAGIVTAIAMGAVGLSFRKLTTMYEEPDRRPIIVTEQRMAPLSPPSSVAIARTFNPGVEIDLRATAPAARFWLLAFALAFITALGGLFVLVRGASIPLDQWKQPKTIAQQIWIQIRPEPKGPGDKVDPTLGSIVLGHRVNRLIAHSIAGTAIVVLPLFLAFLARFAPRQRTILCVCTLLLVAALAAQVWLGILLLYDTSDGPIKAFNTAEATN